MKGEYMKEIIPLKKDIVFKTKIAEVTSINLEHDYKILDDMVEGTVYLSGSYKMTEASVIEEDFVYNIPFSIAISKRIDNSDVAKVLFVTPIRVLAFEQANEFQDNFYDLFLLLKSLFNIYVREYINQNTTILKN